MDLFKENMVSFKAAMEGLSFPYCIIFVLNDYTFEMTIDQYLFSINNKYKQGNATEHTFRGNLEQLIEGLVPEIRVTNEPKRQTCGASDYKARLLSDVIERALTSDERIKYCRSIS